MVSGYKPTHDIKERYKDMAQQIFDSIMNRYTKEQQYMLINKMFINALKQDRHAPQTFEEFAEWCEIEVNR